VAIHGVLSDHADAVLRKRLIPPGHAGAILASLHREPRLTFWELHHSRTLDGTSLMTPHELLASFPIQYPLYSGARLRSLEL
jgi:hypothetical protein